MAAAGAVAGEAGTAAEEAVLVGIAALRLASRGETRVPGTGASCCGCSWMVAVLEPEEQAKEIVGGER